MRGSANNSGTARAASATVKSEASCVLSITSTGTFDGQEAGIDSATMNVGTVAPDFTLLDQAERPWTLSEHLDAAALLVFYRGDW